MGSVNVEVNGEDGGSIVGYEDFHFMSLVLTATYNILLEFLFYFFLFIFFIIIFSLVILLKTKSL